MADSHPPTVPESAPTQSFSTLTERLPADLPATPEVPGYEVVRVVGRGGMGIVYEARDRNLQRTVAVKMILLGPHAGAKDRARFRQEAEAVARLSHPGIVQIFEVGEAPTGPFLVLEFVGGGSLAEKLDGKPWAAGTAARLIEELADAVEAAHQSGIVHRDLKPANILLPAPALRPASTPDAATDARPGDAPWHSKSEVRHPKITDFGLAKRIDSNLGNTNTGAVLGTPSYMAPEQAEGKSSLIGPPTDVYALGAVLYELFTGRPPFLAETPFDTIMQVSRQEPVPPRALNHLVPRDLETICLKCLRKEPERRYPSAAALVDDLRRFREGLPILARPVGPLERGWRWCRRNPVVAASLSALALALAAGAVVASYFAWEARQREKEARASAEAATVSAAEAIEARKLADHNLFAARINLAQNALRENRLVRLRELLRATEGEHAGWEWHYLRRQSGEGSPPAAVVGPIDHPGCLAVAPARDGARVALVRQVEERSGATDGVVECRVLDAGTGKTLFSKQVPLKLKFGLTGCALSRDGRVVAAGVDTRITLWDVATGAEVWAAKAASDTGAFALSPAGDLVAWNAGGRVEVRAVDGGEVKFEIPAPNESTEVHRIEFSADGRKLYFSRFDAAPNNYQVAAATLDSPKPRAVTLSVKAGTFSTPFAVSDDGRLLAFPNARQTVETWELTRGRLASPVASVADKSEALALSPDGRLLAVGGANGLITVHDRVDDGAGSVALRGHDAAVWSLKFVARRKLVSVCADGRVREWDLDAAGARRLLGRSGPADGSVVEPVFDAGGETLAQVVTVPGNLGTSRRELQVIDVVTGRARLRRDLGVVPPGEFSTQPRGKVALSPDGRRVACVLFKQEDLDMIRAAAGAVPGIFARLGGGTGNAPKAIINASLRAVLPQTDVVRVYDVGSREDGRVTAGAELCSFALGGLAENVSFSPDGRRLLIDGRGWRVHDAASGILLASGPPANGVAHRAAFHPDGRRVAVASSWGMHRGEEVIFLDAVPRTPRAGAKLWLSELGGPDGPALPLAGDESELHMARLQFSPSGRYLTAVAVDPTRAAGSGTRLELPLRLIVWRCGEDGIVTRSWAAAFGTMFPIARTEPMALAFSDDESQIAAGAFAGQEQAEVRVWDLAGGEQRHAFRMQTGVVEMLAFTPGGRRLLAAGGSRFGSGAHSAEALVWDLTTGQELLSIPLGGTVSSTGCRTTAHHFDGKVLKAAGWDDKGGELRILDGSPAE